MQMIAECGYQLFDIALAATFDGARDNSAAETTRPQRCPAISRSNNCDAYSQPLWSIRPSVTVGIPLGFQGLSGRRAQKSARIERQKHKFT
jgi:hypothetical protein